MKTYKALEALEYMKKFNKENILISGKSIDFDLTMLNKYIPYLLGLQFMSDDKNRMVGLELYNYVTKNKLSDLEILDTVEKNYSKNIRDNVEKRINTFVDFMKTLDKGYITEQRYKSEIGINYLIVQEKEKDNKTEYYQLAIVNTSTGSLITNFNETSKEALKTHLIKENIEKIERYDEKTASYVPFSFDVDVNKNYEKEYEENLKYDPLNRDTDNDGLIDRYDNSFMDSDYFESTFDVEDNMHQKEEKPSIIEKLNRPLKEEEKTHKNTKTKNKDMEL